MANIRMVDPDTVYNTIRSAFYDMMVLTLFRNVIDNMGAHGQRYVEDFLATFKAEMVRQAEREARAIADEHGSDFNVEEYTGQMTAMVDEVVMEFRDILRKR